MKIFKKQKKRKKVQTFQKVTLKITVDSLERLYYILQHHGKPLPISIIVLNILYFAYSKNDLGKVWVTWFIFLIFYDLTDLSLWISNQFQKGLQNWIYLFKILVFQFEELIYRYLRFLRDIFPFSTSYSNFIATLLVKTPHTSSSYDMKKTHLSQKNILYTRIRFSTSFYSQRKTLTMGLQKDICKVLMLIRYDVLFFFSFDCSKSDFVVVPNYIISNGNKTSRDFLLRECLNKQTNSALQDFFQD